MAERVLCCNSTTISIRFPGMIAKFRPELEAFCSDVQPNHNIVHTAGTPWMAGLPTKTVIQLCCSASTSVVQVDKSVDGVIVSTRLFMRDKRTDRGDTAGLSTITEIRDVPFDFISRHWDTNPLAKAGTEEEADRLWFGQMWSIACLDFQNPEHESIRFRCIQRQQVTCTKVILQELDRYESSLSVLGASNGGADDGSLTQ